MRGAGRRRPSALFKDGDRADHWQELLAERQLEPSHHAAIVIGQ
jgi:hypothetical protein